jgi:hypothetical protein
MWYLGDRSTRNSAHSTLIKTVAAIGAAVFFVVQPAHSKMHSYSANDALSPVNPTVLLGIDQTGQELRQQNPCDSPANPVVAENCLPGTDDWIVKSDLDDIEGFAYPPTVNKGETVSLYVKTAAPQFHASIFRSGYYQGLGGRLIQDLGEMEHIDQPACHSDPYHTGLTSCNNWTSSYDLTVPDDWVSGIYIVKLSRSDTGGENYALFVVRDDERDADILYQESLFTYHAYNNYGGKSIYTFNSGTCDTDSLAARGVKVSLFRPFGSGMAITANYFNNYFRVEFPMVRWLEAQGYDVTYSTTLDTHRSGKPDAHNELLDHKVFLSVGHDEYWTQEMRDAVTAARDAGVHLGIFSGNTTYWRVRMEPDPWTGEPDSVIVSYKTTEAGRPDPSGHPTGTWRDPESVNDPENSMIGSMYVGDNDYFYFPVRVAAQYAGDRIYRHTDLQQMPPDTYVNIGDKIVGWEWDAVVDNGHSPDNVEVLATTPVYGFVLKDAGNSDNGTSDFAVTHITRYIAPSGAIVFSGGTIQWSWGLGAQGIEPVPVDPYIQQITYNVLSDMGVSPVTPADSIVLDGESGTVGYGEAAFVDASVAAPTLSHINITTPNIGLTAGGRAARIEWWTDTKTQAQIWLGDRKGHTIEPLAQVDDFSHLHAIDTATLWPDTDYYIRIMARDENGQIAVSDELSFHTPNSYFVKGMRLAVDTSANVQCWRGKNPTQVRIAGGAVLVVGVLGIGLVGQRTWGLARRRRRRGETSAEG